MNSSSANAFYLRNTCIGTNWQLAVIPSASERDRGHTQSGFRAADLEDEGLMWMFEQRQVNGKEAC